MAGLDISNRVKYGLAKAATATGGNSSIVELEVESGGVVDPIFPVAPTVEWVTLVDCIFSVVNANQIDGELIKVGDISFTSNSDNAINPADKIRRDGITYIVKTINVINPSGVVIAYKGTARAI